MRSLATRSVVWARALVLGIGVLTTVTFNPAAKAGRAATPPAIASSAVARTSYFTSEVRLRKLHLVRPDLIPYPINFEVYC